ncbi:hypothetical protein Leryth_024839, partial [Lithospermum erythrorhizon]
PPSHSVKCTVEILSSSNSSRVWEWGHPLKGYPAPPPMLRQPSASSTTLNSDYHHQPPHLNQSYDANADNYAKRMRKIGQRRAVDYTSTVVRYMQVIISKITVMYRFVHLTFQCSEKPIELILSLVVLCDGAAILSTLIKLQFKFVNIISSFPFSIGYGWGRFVLPLRQTYMVYLIF